VVNPLFEVGMSIPYSLAIIEGPKDGPKDMIIRRAKIEMESICCPRKRTSVSKMAAS